MKLTRHVPFTLAIGSESYFLALPASPVSGETRPPVDDNPLSPQTSVQLAILANALGSTGEPLTAGFGANPAGETGILGVGRSGDRPQPLVSQGQVGSRRTPCPVGLPLMRQ